MPALSMIHGLVQNVQRIGAVIHKVDACGPWNNRQAKETARSRYRAGRCYRLIDESVCNLRAARRGFNNPAIVAVHSQNVSVGRDGQP